MTPIDVEVLVENLHRAAVCPGSDSSRPIAANLIVLEPSRFPEDFQTAERNADIALWVPAMVRIPKLVRPVPRFAALVIRRLLNPFACVQRLFNRAVLQLIDRLGKDTAYLELEVARQRQLIRKLERLVAAHLQPKLSLPRTAKIGADRTGAVENAGGTLRVEERTSPVDSLR